MLVRMGKEYMIEWMDETLRLKQAFRNQRFERTPPLHAFEIRHPTYLGSNKFRVWWSCTPGRTRKGFGEGHVRMYVPSVPHVVAGSDKGGSPLPMDGGSGGGMGDVPGMSLLASIAG